MRTFLLPFPQVTPLGRPRPDGELFWCALSDPCLTLFLPLNLHSPRFVFPMPKGDGFESWFWAQQGNHALLTTLEEFKQLGANAAAHVQITFYDELKEDKGLFTILTNGDGPVRLHLHSQKAWS
jgi:ATP11 protein